MVRRKGDITHPNRACIISRADHHKEGIMEITEEWGVVVALQRVCALVCVLLFVAWISACSSRVPMDRDMVFSIVFFRGNIYDL